jgi:hypothetical protein
MRKFFLAILLTLVVSPALAAPQTYSLGIANGRLTGPGAAILRAQLPNAQFILYGEDHGFADSPIVLHALARDARGYGFRYCVMEVGPISLARAGEALSKNGPNGVRDLLKTAPLAFPFVSLKDDAELASDFLGRDGKGTPYLWGVDQEFILSAQLHLQRLVDLANEENVGERMKTLLGAEHAAVERFDQKSFLLNRFGDADFAKLAAEFKGVPEAESIIAELKESATIYQLWSSGRNYENNARRARLLAQHFLSDYRAAADPMPKVIFKMGAEHVALGTTTINTVDLGTLASSIAKLNGQTALRIAFIPTGGHALVVEPKQGRLTAVEPYDSPDSKELFAAIGIDSTKLSKSGWTLIPLDPIRQTLDNKGLNALKPFARFMLLGFDYVITTPDAKAATPLG